MGFGFNLGMIFIVLPLSIFLVLIWSFTKNDIFLKALSGLWIMIVLLVITSFLLRPFFTKKVLDRQDYYGDYIIDRDFFKGHNADWQYNSFRFTITPQDSIFFHITEGASVLETHKGIIKTVKPTSSHRLIVEMEDPGHHVLQSNPTTYRDV